MLNFTESGLLTPAEGIPITADELFDTFVRPFSQSETRARLFNEWTTYNRMLRQEIGADFVQWINGSFATQKSNPKDVDLVSFIPSYLFRTFEKRLDYYWSDNWEREGIDAYFIIVRHPDEPDYYKTVGDISDWHQRYTGTKPLYGQPRQPKGFLTMTIT